MFELTLNKQDILTPLLMVSGAIDKKQALAILSNILIKLTPQQLILTATDLEIEIISRIPCSSENDNGTVTISAKKLIDIIRTLEESPPLSLRFQDGLLLLKQGRSQFKITTLAATEYPSMTEDVNKLELCVKRLEFIHLLQSTAFAMAQQDVRVYLNSLFLELNNATITSVSMDGHRMAICKLACDMNIQHHRLLLPKKGVQEILRLLQIVEDDTINIFADDNHIKIVTTHYTFFSKLTEARFPSYARAIPVDQDKSVLIDRESLKRALSRMMILTSEKSRAVLLSVQDNQLTLIANNQEQEEATESLAALTQGGNIEIGINANYLAEVLHHLPEGNLRLSFSDIDSSILVDSPQDTNYQYIIMPMKI
jgi:DNA polymerase III subunit beta